MRLWAIVLLIFAGMSTLVAFQNVFSHDVSPNSAYGAGYVVGSFLVPLALLIGGLSLLNKANEADRRYNDGEYDDYEDEY